MTTNAAYTTPSNILSIVESHMAFLISKVNSEHEQSMIVSALKILLNGSYTRYRFSNGELGLIKNLSNDSLQALLSSMNERSETRKERGVYYTPVDVTAFIVKTCFNKYLEASQERHASRESACKGLLFDATVFDPTCGSGEFIRDALKAKIRLLEKSRHSKTSGDFLNIVSTLSGNDLNPESVEITKIRIFFEVLPYIDKEYYAQLARTLNSNFHTHDFINCDHLVFGKKDIILGNPPYIEDRKSKIPLARRYGNIYANVLDECIGILKEGGIMGMIIPISYISTPRMEKIRQIIRSETDYEILLNYADRPSCLFTAVHQKLTILIARKGRGEHKVFTSGYRYW
ncbi:MAG: Eco57I restriction-modification methylase domain-containing protein, partial [Candidatus Methanoplasma sp.]|nr:Eco57I restriction-modification methylase domain-containing protein [Candidatus Methanoplasma sp.]